MAEPPDPHAAPAPPRARTGRAAPLERAAEWLVPRENPSGAVYGVVVTGALLAAESGSHESHLDTVASVATAAALYWLAHAYSGLLGRRLAGAERLTLKALWRSLAYDWALVRGAAVPLIALVLAWLLGAAQATSVNIALWSAVVSLLALELIAGARSHVGRGELVLQASVGLAMGLAIIALKTLLS